MAALSEMFDTADAACAPADTLPAHDACQWTFDLRAPAALALYEGLVADLSACWEGLADTGVNHPDSYRAMTFEAPGARVVVSEKDKSVLDATLVTLRVYPASGG
ncbi:hypothetical protein [Pseudaestuariivita atlantica]|uniref:hypothetical protein n=1 Tax=Pseudaestuariivita atlantica TaxID=1317121 RepID=UPI00067C5AED|nr:hypothetical protein [Pseudaestuariivita atlantica]